MEARAVAARRGKGPNMREARTPTNFTNQQATTRTILSQHLACKSNNSSLKKHRTYHPFIYPGPFHPRPVHLPFHHLPPQPPTISPPKKQNMPRERPRTCRRPVTGASGFGLETHALDPLLTPAPRRCRSVFAEGTGNTSSRLGSVVPSPTR